MLSREVFHWRALSKISPRTVIFCLKSIDLKQINNSQEFLHSCCRSKNKVFVLPDEDPYYFNRSYSFKKSYIIYFIDVTPMSVFGNPDGLSLLLGLWNFRNCKITVQFLCLNSISRRDFYEFLQKRETVLHRHALGQNRCNQKAEVVCEGTAHKKHPLASVVQQKYSCRVEKDFICFSQL